MIVYAESSAVTSWLLAEPSAPLVTEELKRATMIVTSALTGLECAQALTRARVAGRITVIEEFALQRTLEGASRTWNVYDISADVLERAKAPIGDLQLRTFDALHVATFALISDTLGPITMLSLDKRVRVCAQAAGFSLAPREL